MSSENAAILSNCKRWPLLVDPQLQVRRTRNKLFSEKRSFKFYFYQGVKWIRGHFGDDLRVVQMGQKGYLDIIEKCLSEGAFMFFLCFLAMAFAKLFKILLSNLCDGLLVALVKLLLNARGRWRSHKISVCVCIRIGCFSQL